MKVKQLIKILSSFDYAANLVIDDSADDRENASHYAVNAVDVVDAFTDDDTDAIYESKNGLVSFHTQKISTPKPVTVKQALNKLKSASPKSEVVINVYTSPTEETYHSVDSIESFIDKNGFVSLKAHSAMKLQDIDTSSVYLAELPF